MKILMVCLGNICRSPLAEGILQDKAWKAGLNWSVESAGTNGYHSGEAPHRLSQKVALLRGIDISQQCSRKFIAADFDRFDKIYAMAGDVIDEMKRIAKNKYDDSKVELLMNELYPGKNNDVPDPWYGPEPGYHTAYDMIEEACDKIIEKSDFKKITTSASIHMAKINASIPQGTRDFGPETVRKRNYIFNTIRTVFELYGFQPLETPAMENIETLMGKYGDEGDKLIFKVLNNGLNDPKNREKAKTGFENVLAGKNDPALTERALRYDLTIPFARYVAMNHGQLTLPFRRYQMQPVWRADRPQKGRYREFYQCDADVVGSSSLLNEAELTLIYATVFKLLGIPVDIKINNRKILAALAAVCGGSDQLINITIAIDKLDKIGIEKVKEELLERGLSATQVDIIRDYLEINGSNGEKLERIKTILGNNELGQEGITEIESVLNLLSQAVAPANQHSAQTTHDSPLTITHSPFTIDFTLARGLNYYTGIIFEIKAQKVQIGSIGGGGRYDNLTGTFGVPGVAGVGISFGVDRIYDVMEELRLFPDAVQTGTQVLFFNLGATESRQAFILMQALREKGVRSEIYHELAKFDKQFKYAEKKNIAHAVIIGSTELSDHTCTIKNLQTGKQETIAQQSLIDYSF